MRNIVVMCLAVICANGALISDGTAGDQVDGLTLVELGRKTHKPLLTLFGLAVRNLHPCEIWSPWTQCEAMVRGYFGTRTRNRSCVDTKSTETSASYNETETGLCEGHCRPGANLTSHGFCFKLHVVEKSYDDAEATCEEEGGYLINIDSESKHEDVKSMLSGYSNYLYIGSRRKTPSSPWVSKYGSQTPFMKWSSGEPDNRVNDLCLVYYSSSSTWYDVSCSDSRQFLCEII